MVKFCTYKALIFSVFVVKLSFFSSIASAQDAPPNLKKFLDGFISAVTSHNTELVMSLMDADYKKEQHDAFLKGNTQQFLDKFFCGYDPADGETYECMKFKEVSQLKLTSVLPDTGLYIVQFHVTDSDSTVEVTWIVSAKEADGTTTFGMIGTYG